MVQRLMGQATKSRGYRLVEQLQIERMNGRAEYGVFGRQMVGALLQHILGREPLAGELSAKSARRLCEATEKRLPVTGPARREP